MCEPNGARWSDLRRSRSQVAEGRPPDVTAAMLSDPKLADLPGVREAVVKAAKDNLAARDVAMNKAAREVDDKYNEIKSTGDVDKDGELLAGEKAAFEDYLTRSGLADDADLMDGIKKEIEAEDMNMSKAKSQADAAKQAAACLMGAL